MMKPKVERRKADVGSAWPCCLYINASNQYRPQQECDQKTDSCQQARLFISLHIHSVLSVCTSDGINNIEAL
jgi:hypothetical protein